MSFELQRPEILVDEIRETYEPNHNETLPYIGLEHINQQTLTLTGIGNSSDTQSTKRKFRRGDILFGTLRPYFRKVIKARFDGVCSTDIAVLRPKQDSDANFTLYFIANNKFIDYASAHSSGTRMPRTNWRHLSQTEWPIPNQKIRAKIGGILSAYDDLIENNTRRIKILEEMAHTIYREWFIKFRFPGHEKARFVDSPLGMIPEGWVVKKLSEFVDTQYGYTESAQKEKVGPKYVRGTDINKTSYIQWDSVPYCPIGPEKHAQYKLFVGDIVVIRMADPGKVGIIEKKIDAVFASYLIRFHIKNDNLTPYYLFYFLLSDR